MPAGSNSRLQISPITIKVNGSPLAANVMAQVEEVVVEQDLDLPDSFTIRLRDMGDQNGEQTHGALANGSTFPVGASIEISVGLEEAPETIFTGEITALEIDARTGLDFGYSLLVQGYNKAHRLHRARKTKVWMNVADSNVAQQLASANGLTAQVDSTSQVHEYILQDNQTDWEFLRERADRNGYVVYCDGSTLHFRSPSAAATAVPGEPKEYGVQLLSVRIRKSASPQVNSVEVRAWDPQSKQAIVGTQSAATALNAPGDNKTGSQTSQVFSQAKWVRVDQPVATQGEATALAKSIFDEIASDYIYVEGVCLGDQAIRAGRKLQLKGLGAQFDGTYYLTSVTHRVTEREGYLTFFASSGIKPVKLTTLLNGYAQGPSRRGARTAVDGVVVGVVTVNKETDGSFQHRVKVKFPWMQTADGQDAQSFWARLATPMTGAGRGFYFIPEVNDEVLVAFEHGDMEHPYVIGCVWNGVDKPPITPSEAIDATGKVNKRVIKTRAGHTITLDDTQNAAKIEIKTPAGHTVTLDDSSASEKITVIDKTSQNYVKVESPANKITVHCAGELLLEGTQKVTIKGTMVDIQATTQLTMKGTQAQLEGTSNLMMKSSASATVDGGGMLMVKGGMVKIN